MKKKLVAMMLMVCMLTGMTGCGGSSTETGSSETAMKAETVEQSKESDNVNSGEISEKAISEANQEVQAAPESQEYEKSMFTEESRTSLANLWGTNDLQEVRFQAREGATIFQVLIPNSELYLEDYRDVDNLSCDEISEVPKEILPESVDITFTAGNFNGSYGTSVELYSAEEGGFEVTDEFQIEKNSINFTCQKIDNPTSDFWMAYMSGEYEGSYITTYIFCSSLDGEPLPDYKEIMEIVAESIIPIK